jgi:hypothetical protein
MFENIKEFKSQLLDGIVALLRKSKISDKTLGYIIRSVHATLPFLTTSVLIFGPQIYALMTILMLCVAYILFWLFNGCIIHSIEYRLDNIDITLMDPITEILGLELTNGNRLFIAQLIASTYMISVIILYYVRFGSIYLHNNIYDDLNIFKGFYQRKIPATKVVSFKPE